MSSKKFYQSKTFWLNFLTALFLVLESFGVIDAVPEDKVDLLAMAVVAVVNLLLRAVTKEPISW